MVAGYSGTPLVKKLGIKAGHRVALVHEPPGLRPLLVDLPDDVELDADVADRPDVVVAFFTQADQLRSEIGRLEQAIHPDRVLWLAWPKKAAKVDTDVTDQVVRSSALATRLVDVKVCAISEVWSGLKVVWRREHR